MNKLSSKALILLIVGVLVGGIAITAVSYFVSKKHGNNIEAELSAAYDKDRAKLGECIDIALTSAGYATEQSKAMQNALIAAAGGEGLMGASATPAGFSAIITKTFPNLQPYEAAFERGFNATVGCRKDFTQLQNKLIDQIKSFRQWMNNPFTPAVWFGDFPNDALEVKDPATNTFIYGKTAWAMVTTIITNGQANDAYKNGGNYNPGNPFATPAPGTSPNTGATPGTQVSPGGNAPLPAGSPSGR
jgi:hypothetical protein